MLKMVKGCSVPDASALFEEYEIGDRCVFANVSVDKIGLIFKDFISMHDEPMFFILETPTNMKDEEKLRKDDKSPFHKDVYYIDGLDKEHAEVILDIYGKLLIDDGMSQFGFGLHSGSAELMKEKYNVMTFWTKDGKRYADLFERYGISRSKKIVTAWQTFTQENPGECRSLDIDGKSVYDLPDELSEWGIYLAERRENI